MSRRWPDMRMTRDQWSTGDAIAAGVGFIIAIILLLLAIALFAPRAHARDFGQWEDSDPRISLWYRSLMQPDNPGVSCCGKADAYWADKVEVEGDKVFAIITDDRADEPLRRPHVPIGTRIEIPKHKYKFDRGNPTGHNVIFLSVTLQVYCFVQGFGI